MKSKKSKANSIRSEIRQTGMSLLSDDDSENFIGYNKGIMRGIGGDFEKFLFAQI
jgi:hypothetical protein